MRTGKKRQLFDHFRASLTAAGLSTEHSDSIICPLCWQETRYDNLHLQHPIPRALGGKLEVLSCQPCNNDQGSDLDKQLVQHQKMSEAFSGHGTIRTVLNINGNRIAANLEWGKDSKNFVVVAKATNPRTQEQVQAEFKAGAVKDMRVKFELG